MIETSFCLQACLRNIKMSADNTQSPFEKQKFGNGARKLNKISH